MTLNLQEHIFSNGSRVRSPEIEARDCIKAPGNDTVQKSHSILLETQIYCIMKDIVGM